MDEVLASTLYMVIGSRLKAARLRRNYSQDAVANELGIARTSIANLEKGRQRSGLHHIYAYSEAVGLAPSDLFPSLEELQESATPPSRKTVVVGGQHHSVPLSHAEFLSNVKTAIQEHGNLEGGE